jgi:hypothetical protein
MSLIRAFVDRLGALWTGKTTNQRAVIVIGVLILSPILIIGALVGLTYEIVAAVDRNHRLTTNAHWAVRVFAVLGVLVVLSAVSPRQSSKAITNVAAVAPSASPTFVASSPSPTPSAIAEAAALAPASPEPATAQPVTPEPATAEPATAEPATVEPATPEPATPKPATPKPATPKPTPKPAPTPDVMRSPEFVAMALESQYDITFEDSPLTDGTVRKLGRDSTGLVMVELTDDPIMSMSVVGPIPGSGTGTEATIGSVMGAESAAFGDPAGMTDWLLAQMKASGSNSDREVSKRFGKVVAHLQWYAATLGMMTVSFDHD